MASENWLFYNDENMGDCQCGGKSQFSAGFAKKRASAKTNLGVGICPVASSLAVAIFYAGFGLAFTLTRQMLPTGQMPTQQYGFICRNCFGNHTQIAFYQQINSTYSPRCAGSLSFHYAS